MNKTKNQKQKTIIKQKGKGLFADENFALGKQNYQIIAIGMALIIIGFILMTGTQDIFDFRKTGLSVISIMIGFVIVGYAIMKRPKDKEEDNEEIKE